MYKILLIDDSKEIYQMVKMALGNGVELSWAQNIKEGKSKLEAEKHTLLLLDIELPDGNGLEFCNQVLSEHTNLPVFILTVHEELSEKIMGFSAGADDYITKPFNPLELKARVEAKLRKAELLKDKETIENWGEIEINKNTQEVNILNDTGNKKPIDLTALEFKLLTYLSGQANIVIPRDKILDDIWGRDIHVYSRSVDTHISKLRKKLEGCSHLIQSVHGSGYKFSPSRQAR